MNSLNDTGAFTLSPQGVCEHLNEIIPIEVFQSLPSTNALMRERALNGAKEKSVIIALGQTSGRGRLGRSFISPQGGLYMSILIRPNKLFKDISFITPAAAVAVCEAVQLYCAVQPEIKWVNDVFVRGKKVCGILTESISSPDSGKIEYAVLGIGINVTTPSESFPAELRSTAGSLLKEPICPEPERLAALIIKRVFARCGENLTDTLNEYRRLSMLTGREVSIISSGTPLTATVLGINEDYSLAVRLTDGTDKNLMCGEVSVKTR